MINIFFVILLYALVFGIGELAYRKLKFPKLVSRKIAHVAGAFITFFLPYLIPYKTAAIIGLLFCALILISKKMNLLKSIHDKNNQNLGEVFYPLGLAVIAYFIWPASVAAYQAACLVLGLSDGFAGYLGSRFGIKKYPALGGYKTLEGSAIFFFFTALIFGTYYFLYAADIYALGLAWALLCALGVTLVEALFSRGWDNLLVPISAGLFLLLIII